jgi:hypothetical protein
MHNHTEQKTSSTNKDLRRTPNTRNSSSSSPEVTRASKLPTYTRAMVNKFLNFGQEKNEFELLFP